MKNLELGDMIVTLREELAQAQKKGRDEGISFKVEDIELELQVVVQEDTHGKFGAKFYVFNADVGTSEKSVITHRLKLKLIPQNSAGESMNISDEGQM